MILQPTLDMYCGLRDIEELKHALGRMEAADSCGMDGLWNNPLDENNNYPEEF